jgi:hypothetical protein
MPSTEDNQDLIRRRRLAASRMGILFGVGMLAFELVARIGWMDWFPLLRLGAPGPLTLSWILGAVVRESIAGALFGYIMFRLIQEPGWLGGPVRR